MTEVDVKRAWERHWTVGNIERNASPMGRYLRVKRIQIMREMLAPLDKRLSVIDLGCGNGSTLQVIREAGFKNSVGLEYTEVGLRAARHLHGFKWGEDVFLGDAGHTLYPDRFFGLVYSEGLWEHFKMPEPYMDEFCRIADRYIMVIQPNHYSLVGWLMKVGWETLNSQKGGVKEYSFRLEYFTEYLKDKGFKMIQMRSTMFKEQAVLLYERVD